MADPDSEAVEQAAAGMQSLSVSEALPGESSGEPNPTASLASGVASSEVPVETAPTSSSTGQDSAGVSLMMAAVMDKLKVLSDEAQSGREEVNKRLTAYEERFLSLEDGRAGRGEAAGVSSQLPRPEPTDDASSLPPFPGSAGFGVSRRADLPKCPVSMPAFRVGSASARITTKTDLNIYHRAVTLIGYSDSKGTHEVLLEIAQAADIGAGLKSEVQRLTATTNAVRASGYAPSMRRDDQLWEMFLTKYDQHYHVNEWQHKDALWKALVATPRAPQQTPADFLSRVAAAKTLYEAQDYPFPIDESTLVSIVKQLLRLNAPVFGPLRAELDKWLKEAYAEGDDVTLTELSTKIYDTDALQQHISREGRGHGVFNVDVSGSGNSETDGGLVSSNLPTVDSEGVNNDARAQAPVASGWDALPNLSQPKAGYSVDSSLASFGVATYASSKSLALNKFPRVIAGRDASEYKGDAQKMAAVRERVMDILQVKCGRCFKSSCPGSDVSKKAEQRRGTKKWPATKWYLNTECSKPNSKHYVHQDLAWVLFNVLKFVHFGGSPDEKKGAYSGFVRTFYNCGGNFNNPIEDQPSGYKDCVLKIVEHGKRNFFYTGSSRPNVSPTIDKGHLPSQSSFLSMGYQALPYASHMNDSDSHLLRCLSGMPDLGNPSKLAGLCWWRDYSPLLQKVGLLRYVRTAGSDQTAGFGDGPQAKPCFVALQVPFWYKMEDGKVLLVLENIRIVNNVVGLLDGKENLSAMNLKVSLSPETGSSTFHLLGRQAVVDDNGNHFFLRLKKPEAICKNTTALSLRKCSDGQTRCVEVKCARKHIAQGFIGNEPHLNVHESSVAENKNHAIDISIEAATLQNGSLSSSSSIVDTEINSEDSNSDSESLVEPWPWMLSNELPDNTDSLQEAGRGDKIVTMLNVNDLSLKNINHLHRALGHPSKSELEHELARAGHVGPKIKLLLDSLECSRCEAINRRQTPSRPRAAIRAVMRPGEQGRMDVGHFRHPTMGKFCAVVGVDAKSGEAFGDAIENESGKEIATVFVNRCAELYREITYDLAGFARGSDFVNFMSRMGVEARYVPTEAHWGNSAETAIHMLRKELDGVYAEFADLNKSECVQLAIKRLNSRIMPQYGMSRSEIQRGRKFREPTQSEQVMSAAPYPLAPEWHQLRKLVEGAQEVSKLHDKRRAGLTLARALKSRPSASVDLQHGDSFLYYRSGLSKADKGFVGPAKCIGVSGGLVIGWGAGAVVTAHITRCLKVASGENRRPVFIDPTRSCVPMLKSLEDLRQPLLPADISLEAEKDPESSQWDEGFYDLDADPFGVGGGSSETPIGLKQSEDPETNSPMATDITSGETEKERLPIAELPLLPVPEAVERLMPVADESEPKPKPSLTAKDVGFGSDAEQSSRLPVPKAVDITLPTADDSELEQNLLSKVSSSDTEQAPLLPVPEAVETKLPKADDSELEQNLPSNVSSSDNELTLQLPVPEVVEQLLTKADASDLNQARNLRAEDSDPDLVSRLPFVDNLPTPRLVEDNSRLPETEKRLEHLLSSLPFSDIVPMPRVALDSVGISNAENDDENAQSRGHKRSRSSDNSERGDESRARLSNSSDDEKQNVPERRRSIRLAKKRLREIAEASRRGLEFPAVMEDEDEVDETPEAQKQYFKKQRMHHIQAGPKKWYDDEQTFNDIFSNAFESKLPDSLSADHVHYYQPAKTGVLVQRIYLMNKSKQRTVVLDYNEASRDPDMRSAMEAEIASFRHMDCVEEVPLVDLESQDNKISTRWVLTLKTTSDGRRKCKARLVARGFEDLEQDIITRDSPVASSASQRLVVQACVENQYRIHSWDFKNAFLQGRPMLRTQPVYIMPPMGFGVKSGCVWRLKRPVYGLSSAPKAWYDRLLEVMEASGLDSKLSDEGVLRMVDSTGTVVGLLAIHVDDTIGGGTSVFHAAMEKVSKSLKVGATERDNFYYKGLRVTTHWHSQNDGGEFYMTVDGDEYLEAALEMKVPEGKDSELLSGEDIFNYRSVAGCIGYCSNAFRPELSLECSMLGRKFFDPTIGDARIANATLKWAKENRYDLKFEKGKADALTVFCDSAGPNEHGTQGGRLLALTDSAGHKIGSFIFWESRKVRRVCKATITGETLSAGEGHEAAMWIQQIWFELTGQKIGIRMVVDSEGLHKNAGTTKLPLQKRLRIDMASLRQGLRRGEFVMTWVPSQANLSDPLTKARPNSAGHLEAPNSKMKKPLLHALRTNNTGLRGVRQVTKTQADVTNY